MRCDQRRCKKRERHGPSDDSHPASGAASPVAGPDAEEEAAKKAAEEEEARKAAEEAAAAQKAAEEEAAGKAAEEEAARKAAEEAAAAQKAAEEEAAKKAAEEEAARKAAEEEAARKAAADEAAAAEEAARKAAEQEANRKAAEEEAAKKAAAEEAARKAAEEEAARKAAEEAAAAQKAADEEAARKAAEEEAARKAAEEEAARRAAEEEAARKAAEEAAAAQKAAEEEAAKKAAEEEAARKAAEEEAAKKEAIASQPQTPVGQRRAPPPPPPRPKPKQLASPGGSRVGSMSPAPEGDAEGGNSPSSAIHSGAASPSGSRADHSLHGLWQSQTPGGRPPPPPMADGDPQEGANSPANGSAPNTGRLMTPTSARRAPGPMIPGPAFIDTDFEDTLKSNASFVSDSPGGRKAHSLGGLAKASANVVAADKQAGKVATPQHSARSSRPPIRAVVPTRSPRTEVQAQERLLGKTLPP